MMNNYSQNFSNARVLTPANLGVNSQVYFIFLFLLILVLRQQFYEAYGDSENSYISYSYQSGETEIIDTYAGASLSLSLLVHTLLSRFFTSVKD